MSTRPVQDPVDAADMRQSWADDTDLAVGESSLRAILDTAVDGIIIIDAHGTVRLYNPACQKIFGYSPEEVIGHNVKMLMPSPYHEEHDGYLQHYRDTGER